MNQHQYSRHEISDAEDHSEDGQLRTPHFMDTGGDDRNNRYGIILIWQSINIFLRAHTGRIPTNRIRKWCHWMEMGRPLSEYRARQKKL